MKSILISIHPEYCHKIFNEKKQSRFGSPLRNWKDLLLCMSIRHSTKAGIRL